MIDPRIPPTTVLAALFDSAATVLEFADREPAVIAHLPEPMRAFVAAAEPACRAFFSGPAQREFWPGVEPMPGLEPVRAAIRRRGGRNG